MNNKDFQNKLSNILGISQKDVDLLQKTLNNKIEKELLIEKSITFPGIGTIEPKLRAERKICLPNNQGTKTVPQNKTLTFKPYSSYKEQIKNLYHES